MIYFNVKSKELSVFLPLDNGSSCRLSQADPEQVAWQRRLASLTEVGLTYDECRCAWQSD